MAQVAAAAAATVIATVLPELISRYGPKVMEKIQQLTPVIQQSIAKFMSSPLSLATLQNILSSADFARISKQTSANKDINVVQLYQDLDPVAGQKAVQSLIKEQLSTKQVFSGEPDPKTQQLLSDTLTLIFSAVIRALSKRRAPGPVISPAHGYSDEQLGGSAPIVRCLFDILADPNMDQVILDMTAIATAASTSKTEAIKRAEDYCGSVREAVVHSEFFAKDFFASDDNFHISLITEGDWCAPKNIVHILHVLEAFVKSIIDNVRWTNIHCELCLIKRPGVNKASTAALVNCKKSKFAQNCEAELEERYHTIFTDLWDRRADIALMLNTHYSCGLTTATNCLRLLRPPCNPYRGTFPWDMNMYMIEMFKRAQSSDDLKYPVIYHGVLYSTTENLKSFVEEVFCTSSKVSRHAFLYATGSNLKPKHWCGIWLDLSARIAIFYNSLGNKNETDDKKSDVNWRIVDEFNELCLKVGRNDLRIQAKLTNLRRLQGDSNFCGHFVYDFFQSVMFEPSETLITMFGEYTNPPGLAPGKYMDDRLHYKQSQNFFFSTDPCSMFASKFRPLK